MCEPVLSARAPRTGALRDAAFAREFLLAAMDEGVAIQVALGKVIGAMGVKEFAAKVDMAAPNVQRAIIFLGRMADPIQRG
jgi:hypothetical protein